MNDRQIEIIIHATDEKYYSELVQALQSLVVPKGFSCEVRPITREKKYAAYNTAMRASDAKYKIYMDERTTVTNQNFLSELLEIFNSDKTIGLVGVTGAVELSTNGISVKSFKRTYKDFSGEVEAVDFFFLATQYDLPWRHDLFTDDFFGRQAQCIEFKRAGYKVFVARQSNPWVAYQNEKLTIDDANRQKFLDEYSKDLFPLVSVIIPTFNRPKYFREALNSALNQTYRNIEVVVSDNSTEDDTERLIQDYLARDKRIKYFRHENFTSHDNWNFVRNYDNPAAEYVNWLMDDDIFYPTKLEKMVDAYRNNPDVSLVTSAKNFIDADGKVIGNTKKLFGKNMKLTGDEAGRYIFLLDNYIGEPTTVLIRKKFLRDNDLCWHEDERGFFSLVDVSTWLHLLTQGNLIRLIECLSGFRQHAKQATYWSSTYALTPVSWIKLFKAAWDKKIFVTTEQEFRVAAMRLLPTCTNRLKEFYEKDVHTKEVASLEKAFFALVDSLRNGYKIELPPTEYSAQGAIRKIR